jgi:hypothetical protein
MAGEDAIEFLARCLRPNVCERDLRALHEYLTRPAQRSLRTADRND